MAQHSHYATGWTTDESWFESRHGQEVYLLREASKPPLGTMHPPTEWALGALSGCKAARD
jgi:hypothetical protein